MENIQISPNAVEKKYTTEEWQKIIESKNIGDELLQAKKENQSLGQQLFDLQTLLISKGVI